MSLIQGRTGDWEVVIGLEVHAQVTSKSKLFSGASTEFGAEPNEQVALVDAAMPGMLPVINEKAVEQAVRTGLGLNAEINLKSIFDRKNYFILICRKVIRFHNISILLLVRARSRLTWKVAPAAP